MIVEFIGSTGAGKTTLIRGVHRRLGQIRAVSTPFELIASPLGLATITHPSARNLIQEVAGLPFFLRALEPGREFAAFVLKMLARQARFSIFTLNILRSLERKVGVYEIIRHRADRRVVLVDEGPLLLAHNLFVYSDAVYGQAELARFASLVPLPDAVVYVRAPIEILVQRTLLRNDPPRELRPLDRHLVEKHVSRAAEVFEQMIETERFRGRVLIVDNSSSNGPEQEVVNSVIEFIQDGELRGKSPGASYQIALERPK